MRKVVVNSTPLIVLYGIGRLDLLQKWILYGYPTGIHGTGTGRRK